MGEKNTQVGCPSRHPGPRPQVRLLGVRKVRVDQFDGAFVRVGFNLAIDTQMRHGLEWWRPKNLLEPVVRYVVDVSVAVVARFAPRLVELRCHRTLRRRKGRREIEDDKAAWLRRQLRIELGDVPADAVGNA